MKEGDVIDVQLVRVTRGGKGIGFSDLGDLVFIEGVEEGDQSVKVKIMDVGVETMSGMCLQRRERVNLNKKSDREIEDPYGIDDEQEEIEG